MLPRFISPDETDLLFVTVLRHSQKQGFSKQLARRIVVLGQTPFLNIYAVSYYVSIGVFKCNKITTDRLPRAWRPYQKMLKQDLGPTGA